MDPKETLDPKEMRKKLARALLEEMIYTQEARPLYKVISELLASAPQGILRVTISVDGVDKSALNASDLREVERSHEKDPTLSVLVTRVIVDGKDNIDRTEDEQRRGVPAPHDYVLATPSSDTT